jgi:hypothetical protein
MWLVGTNSASTLSSWDKKLNNVSQKLQVLRGDTKELKLLAHKLALRDLEAPTDLREPKADSEAARFGQLPKAVSDPTPEFDPYGVRRRGYKGVATKCSVTGKDLAHRYHKLVRVLYNEKDPGGPNFEKETAIALEKIRANIQRLEPSFRQTFLAADVHTLVHRHVHLARCPTEIINRSKFDRVHYDDELPPTHLAEFVTGTNLASSYGVLRQMLTEVDRDLKDFRTSHENDTSVEREHFRTIQKARQIVLRGL